MARCFGLGPIVCGAIAFGGSSPAFAQEATVATCQLKDLRGQQATVLITQRGDQGFWTEGDRRTEARLVRSRADDTILGITANRLDGSIALLSLHRPAGPPFKRRRNALLTKHLARDDGTLFLQNYTGVCDVEDIR